MISNLVVQSLFYVAVLVALAKPLGSFMARVFEGERTFLHPVLGSGRAPDLPSLGRRRQARNALDRVCGGGARIQLHRLPRRVRAATAAGHAAAQSRRTRRGVARLVVQYRGQLRHQHQLAGLRRREHDELSHADARPGGAELRLRRDRHRGADRVDPGLRAARNGHHRQFLGRPHALHAVRAAAAVDPARGGARQPGRGADLRALCEGPDARSGRLRGSEERTGRQAARRRAGQAGDGEEDHAASRRCRSAPRPPRSRSSSSAPTAAAFSTSTRRTRSRTRPRSRISWRCWRSW